MRFLSSFFFLLALFFLVGLTFFPQFDVSISSLFAKGDAGFPWRDEMLPLFFEKTAFGGARFLAVFFLFAGLVSFFTKKSFLFFSGKRWVFLFLALLIGPGLVANVVFKDHWGRARPRDIVQFGGEKTFTPAFIMADQCEGNCSFVSGDASFGFFLPCLAFLFTGTRSRRTFWSMMLLGSCFAFARLAIGAHFLSDILAAGLVSLGTGSLLYMAMFSRKEMIAKWQNWLFISPSAQQ